MLTIAEVERFFAAEPPELLEIILELRNLIFSVAPQTTELIQWKGLSYYDASRGGTVSANLCQIQVVAGCVQLGFIHGMHLPDPAGLLQGTRKSKRYMRLCSFESVPWQDIQTLLEASSRFDVYEFYRQLQS